MRFRTLLLNRTHSPGVPRASYWLSHLKKNDQCSLPVIVLTSSKEDQDIVNSYKLGVNSYIQKPVDFGSFQQIIGQLGLYWLVVNQAPPATAFSR
jgi:two-component system response regulator